MIQDVWTIFRAVLLPLFAPVAFTDIDVEFERWIPRPTRCLRPEAWKCSIEHMLTIYPYGLYGTSELMPKSSSVCETRLSTSKFTGRKSLFCPFNIPQVRLPVAGLRIFDYFRYGTYKVHEASLYIDCLNLAECARTFNHIFSHCRYNLHKTDVFNTTFALSNPIFSASDFSVTLKLLNINPEDAKALGLSKTTMKFDINMFYKFRAK